jgi:YD repeat-containing protein
LLTICSSHCIVADGSLRTTYTYDDDGNQTVIALQAADLVTLSYDKENRMARHQDGATVVTYTYAADGLKRSEVAAGGTTTLVWDGTDYLQGRS